MRRPERNRMRRDRDRKSVMRSRRQRARKLTFEALEIRRVLTAETLQLSFGSDDVLENAGEGGLAATLTRISQFNDYTAAVTVSLDFSDASELDGVSEVSIPAGLQSIQFALDVVDDAILDGDQSVTVTASADGFLASTTEITVKDHETLTLHVASGIREDGGSLSVEIERSDVDDLQARSFNLNSDNSAINSASLVLPEGVARTSFNLTVNDDSVLNGSRTVNLAADSSGFVPADAQVTVDDYETLTLSLGSQSISEYGGALSAVLSRSVGATDVQLDITLAIDDASEASAPTLVSIPAGESQVEFQIAAVDDFLIDGRQTVEVTATAEGFEGSEAEFNVLDYEPLSLELSASTIAENASGATLLGTVTRPAGHNQSPLLIAVRSSDPSRLQAPRTITIPAGMDSALFFASPQDDQLLTGPVDVQLTAFALNYIPAEASVVVEDHESLFVSIDREHLRENDTGVMTVTRGNTNVADPLTVTLTATPSNELSLPSTVTIPAGDSSVLVNLNPVDDNVIETPITVTIEASASGYESGAGSVEVVDVELLRLSPSTTSVLENAGSGAIDLTIVRFNEDITSELTVSLQSSDLSELQTPVNVTIPAGQRSVAVALDVVDDTLLDGEQDVEVTATADGYLASSFNVTVGDVESLTLQISTDSVDETDGPSAATAVVTRSNTDNEAPLRVAILNSDASEAEAPSVVEIPAGAQSVTFSIDAIDDLVVDGDQTVTLTAASTGYLSGEDQLKVIDLSGFVGWTNPDNAMDVDDSSTVNVRDALVLVYELRTRGPMVLPQPTPGFRPPPWLDTNGDGNFNTLDVFLVIEHLNNRTGSTNAEGEAAPQQQGSVLPDQGRSTAFVAIDVPPQASNDSLFVDASPRGDVLPVNDGFGDPLAAPIAAPSSSAELAVAVADGSDEPLELIIDDIADDVDDVFFGG